MPVSRRRFLKHGAFAAAACAAIPLPAWSGAQHFSGGVNSPDGTTSQSHIFGKVYGLSRQSFESVVGSAFQVSPTSANSQPVWLTLVAVHDLPGLAPVNVGSMAVPPPKSTSPAPTTTGFMLSFNSSAAPLSQGTYTFQHEKLGQFALFIVPGAPGMQSYTAVFNLLNGATPAPPHFIPPGKLRPAVGTDNAGESNNAVGSSNTGGLEGGGRPAQQPLEPVLRNGLEPKLPE